MRTAGALVGLALCGSLTIPPAAGAQHSSPIPGRPKLAAGVDTNDAQSYYSYGLLTISENPSEAMRGFYWTMRLDPGSADALYALHSANLLALSPKEMAAYDDFSPSSRRSDFLAIDSLLFRAYAINPFLHPRFEYTLLLHRAKAQAIARNPDADHAVVNDRIFRIAYNSQYEADVEYATGRFGEALASYAKMLTLGRLTKADRADSAGSIHATRARIFYQLGNMDSARAELVAAIEALKDRDAKRLVILYRSKAVYEQLLGMIAERQGNPDGARGAYGEALTEDLSYFPAHVRMAQLQLAKGDTAGAATEMDLAVQLRPGDPALRYGYALMLAKMAHDADAVGQLNKSIASDAYYAAPHFLLARIADGEQYTDDAVTEYGRFIAMAAKSDPQLAMARERLSKLTATVATAPAPVPAPAKPE